MRVSTRSWLLAGVIAVGSLCSQLAQASIVFADLGKNLEFQQTGPSVVTPFNGGVNAFIFGRTFYPLVSEFDGGALTFAGPASPQPYNISGLLDCCGDNGRGYQSGYMTQADLDANFPTGVVYTLTATNSGTSASQSVNIAYANDLYTSDVPALDSASFTALQNANPAAGLTLSFNSFTPNPLADFGQGFFTIFDFTSNTTVANFTGLSPSTTSVFLAPGTLSAGHQYVYELIFDDVIAGSDNGVFTDARSGVRTFGDFNVRGAVPEPASWALMLVGFGGLGAMLRRGRRLSAA